MSLDKADRHHEEQIKSKTAPIIRRLIFLSHATPEDNAFAGWLASQLTIHGYEVWCDLTKLLGGEKFWNDIDEAIDRYAFRVLFASTLQSNQKPGTLRELTLALETGEKHVIKDFLVPLKVDQFPFESTDPRIREMNFVRFDESWEVGLKQLLNLLEREQAPKSPNAGAKCVTEWRQRSLDPRRKHIVRDDTYFSNWFELELPKQIYFHHFTDSTARRKDTAKDLPYPHRSHGEYLITFATSLCVNETLGPTTMVASSIEVKTHDFITKGDERLRLGGFDSSNIVTDLVQQAWNATLEAREFCRHELANGQNAWFFPNGKLEKNKAYFIDKNNRRRSRQLVGNKTKKIPDGTRIPDGYWHYAISGSTHLHNRPRMALHHHVIFTDDGRTPWQNADRMLKARRSVCKNWWNGEWRDRLFAICDALGGDSSELMLDVGGEEQICIAMAPMTYTSPWSYYEDNETGMDESVDIELTEEADDEGDDDENT